MKNLILLFCFVMVATTMAEAQIKVVTNGRTIIGTNAGVTPAEQLHVVGSIALDKPGLIQGVVGVNNTKRVTVSTNVNNLGASSFFTMFGNESLAGGAPARAGEFNLVGDKIFIRAGKTLSNFGLDALVIDSNKDAFFFTPNTFKQGNTNWTVFSDRNVKKDIRAFDGGLEEVLNINPVYFTYNGKAGTDDSREFVGIIAQEYAKVAPYDVSEVTVQTGDYKKRVDETYLGANDAAIKYMLVNAIKEQQAMLENQAEKIAALEELVNTFGSEDQINRTSVTLSSYDLAELSQNRPNPFNQTTAISYVIPSNTKNAQIAIFNTSGQMLKTVNISHVGEGVLDVDASELATGTYSYNLVVDGKIVETNKMVVTK